MLRKCVLVSLALLFMAGCSKKERDIPGNAKSAGEYLVSLRIVKIGMYHAKVFDSRDKTLIDEKNYIYPVSFQGVKEADLSDKVTKYDDNTIYLEKGIKLVACEASEDAVRIQGAKGRVWVDCSLIDSKNNRYYCTIYSAKDGSVKAKGGYVLNKYYWDDKEKKSKYTRVRGRVPRLDFVYYSGIGITVKNKMLLLPDGMIDYPDGRRSGMRVVYDREGTVLREEEY